MKTLSEYEKNGFEGIDASIDISLYEYGMIWKKEGDDYKFIYGVSANEDGEYNKFDYAHISANIDLADEYDWIKWNSVDSFTGGDTLKLSKDNLPMAIFDLVSYYGWEEIFGGSYYPFQIENK